jgi:hypothetical protein
MDDKPMLYVDTRVPSRPTPEPAFFTANSPFKLSTSYTNSMEYSTGQDWTQQNMWYPAAANWTQRVEVMHSTVSTEQQQYHSGTGFLEACKSSVESSSSYSIFSVLSGLSSSYNPFEDIYSTMPSKSLSPSTSQAETNTKHAINTIHIELRKLQDTLVDQSRTLADQSRTLADQSRMLEEVMQVLRVSRRP